MGKTGSQLYEADVLNTGFQRLDSASTDYHYVFGGIKYQWTTTSLVIADPDDLEAFFSVSHSCGTTIVS